MLAYRRETRRLAEQINDNIVFSPSRNLEKLLYTALINEESGNAEEAAKLYQILGTYNPYFEEGVIAAANFFIKQDPESLRPYTMLTDALYANPKSIRLLQAYVQEASRKGFDGYAASAAQRLAEAQARL